MKAQHLLLFVAPNVVEGFVPPGLTVGVQSATTLTGPSGGGGIGSGPSSPTILMDTEGDAIDLASRRKIEALLRPKSPSSSTTIIERRCSIEEAESALGMPWKSSIDASYADDDALLYMPFWEWQMSFMKGNLTDLVAEPIDVVEGESGDKLDFSYNENAKKKARIVSMNFSSREYRKIRMTYYDAGENTQVFNSVWYPSPEYDLPVLGIDLLAFNRKKYLAIVDFQPLHESPDESHPVDFEAVLRPIKDSYDSLKGRMSSKFYDETKFFSQQMLFARFEDESIVSDDLFPAFQKYVEAHVRLVRDMESPSSSSEEMPPHRSRIAILERQQAYDTYSAERDPATGLFAAMFGKEWAEGFVHDFLFSLSERKEGGLAAFMPPMGAAAGGGGGGPPPSNGRQGQQPPPQQQHQPPPKSSSQKQNKATPQLAHAASR